MTAPKARYRRVLVTGAAGRLGKHLRHGLAGLADKLRMTDLRDLGQTQSTDEELVTADLSDMAAVSAIMQDVDLVLHFGAVMPQQPWGSVLSANIIGTFNVFEAARLAGVRRIVYASSNHAVGMYRRTELLDADSPPRPDTLYGVSKAFGENLARMYHDKHGIEFACLRIGSCFDEPTDERMLATWLSHADLVHLCRRCIEAPHLGFAIVYGMSDNTRRWWTNDKTSYLGYTPKDSAEPYADKLLAAAVDRSPKDPASTYQGGSFAFPPSKEAP